jgi:exosortase/archaeosortase family protein
MDAFTEMTLHALHAIVDHVPIATALGGDGSRFAIAHGRGTFTLSVASACAGVNGVVGFFVVGVALLLVVRGPARRKALWLALGLMGIWLLNIVRIVLLFAAGRRFGATVAIDGLHPYIGLALFTAGVMALVAAMPLFRLEWDRVDTAERVGALHTVVRAVPRARYAFAAVCVTAIVLTVANSELRNFELTSDSLGQARLAAFAERPPIVSGVRPQLTSTFDHGRAFFGKDSTWQRFEYTGGQTIVLADVVETSSLGPFNEFTLERCYDFHRFQKLSTETVNLAGGVTADLITWHAASQGTWTALTWVWPVQAGARPRFERVTLLVNAPGYLRDGAAVAAAPVTPVRNLAATLDSALRRNPSKGALNTRMLQTESFIKKFGAALVSAKAMAR